MKKITFEKIISVALCAALCSLAFSACQPQPQPAPQPPSEQGVPGQVSPPAPEDSGAETAGQAAAPETKPFGDVSIVFFPGGNESEPFSTIVYNGAMAAASDMGCAVEFVWSDWQPDKMVSQFQSAIAQNPTGICIMGHPGDAAFAPLVDEARAAGIIVTSQNTALPTIEGRYKAEGFGYVGQELFASGAALGKAAVNRSQAQPGDTAIVWGLKGQEGRGQRTLGVINALEEAGLLVVYYEISDALNADTAQGESEFAGFLDANPEAKLVVVDHGAITSAIGTYLSAAGKAPGDIYAAGFDLSADSVDAINSGYLGCILDQQPWLQGYLPIVQVCLSAKYGFSGLHIDTGASIIDQSNIDIVTPLAQQGIR